MWGQTTAGFIAGLPLAFMSVALLASPWPLSFTAKFAVTVVLGLPMYSVMITAAFAAARGWHAWLGLMAANAIGGLLLWAVIGLGWYGVPGGLS